MLPALIQAQLQSYYDLHLEHHVDDFLITDRGVADSLESNPDARDTSEKLLVLEEPDGLSIALFLADDVLNSLQGNNPFERLDGSNLGEFCMVLEGVSHFTYLTFNANHDRPVSRLEMELQAEVDKFVSIVLLADEQGGDLCFNELLDFLFARCRFDSALNETELARYRAASDYASTFCSQLVEMSGGEIGEISTRSRLRRFYRKRHLDKLSRCLKPQGIQSP